MKLECIIDKLYSAVIKANRISGKKLSLLILNNISLKAKDNILTIQATNLDVGIKITIPVKIYIEGEIIISGSILSSFLSNLKNDQSVMLEKKETTLSLNTKKTSTLIKLHPETDFPTIPQTKKTHIIIVNNKELLIGLRAVWYGATNINIKPELSSVYMSLSDNTITFVSTDSFRLAEKKIKCKTVDKIEPVLIPIKNVSEIISIFEEVNGDIEIVVDKNQISFFSQNLFLTSRLVVGTFPDYQQIIPRIPLTSIIILKEDLLSALNMSQIFSDKFNQVKISALIKDKKLEIVTKNSDIGENTTYIDSTVSGEDVSINFNHKYIKECFQSLYGDSVSLELSGVGKPMVIRSVGDKSFLYLVMPMSK
ncbi:MAG: DNA polymerase III subunit beta [Patescibacteria group bacterium]